MTLKEEALQKHYEWKGKIEVVSRTPITNREQLSLAYTPGVAEPCLAIAEDPMKVYDLTRRHRGSRPGRYRPGGGHARDGGKMCPV